MASPSPGTVSFLPLPERALIVASGPKRVSFLHGMLSNDVQGVEPGHGRPATLMDVKGRLLAWLRVLVDPNEVLLECPRDRAEAVERLLVHYRVAAPVRFARPEVAVLAVFGSALDEWLISAEAELPPLEGRECHLQTRIGGVPVRVIRAGDLPRPGVVLHVASRDQAVLVEALRSRGASLLARDMLDAWRVEAGRAWYGFDVNEENLLHETGWLHECHSASKGCYVGQEVVARLEGRGGNVNKALRGLALTRPAHGGDEIRADGKAIGQVTTAARSESLGPIALGYLHRSHFAAGTIVQVGEQPATVVELPFQPLAVSSAVLPDASSEPKEPEA